MFAANVQFVNLFSRNCFGQGLVRKYGGKFLMMMMV
jgi:hypothetical protein